MAERTKLTAKASEARKNNQVFPIRKPDFSQSTSSPIDHILFLQRTIGNQAVQRLLNPGAKKLAASIDKENPTIIVFNRAVSVEEAAAYLWRIPPKDQDSIRPEPDEKVEKGKYMRFFVDVRNNLGLAMSMQHGLADEYLKIIRKNVIRSNAPPPPPLEKQPTPAWLPAAVKEQIVSMANSGEFGKDLPKVYQFQGDAPWGAIVVWVGPSEFNQDETVIEIVQYYPEESSYYKARYTEPTARRARESSIEWNRDFAYYVEEKKMRPSDAKLQMREESARRAVMIAGAFGIALAGAGGLTSSPKPAGGLRPSLPRGGRPPEAPAPLRIPEETPQIKPPTATKTKPMPEALKKGMLSKTPPVKIKGETTATGPAVRKTVTEETLLGRTRFGKAWGKASLKAQEEALQKLESAGLDTAKIRQSFNKTGELVIEYVGTSVQSQWRSMSAEAKAAYYAYVSMAKKVLGRGPLHDLKMRNIAYERVEVEGVIIHRFTAFDPALDNATLLVGIFVGTAVATGLGIGLDNIVGIITQHKTSNKETEKNE